MYNTNNTPPPVFVWDNITVYTKEWINEKWYIYNYVNESNKSKSECFRYLSTELGKTANRVSHIYYGIKKKSDESNVEF